MGRSVSQQKIISTKRSLAMVVTYQFLSLNDPSSCIRHLALIFTSTENGFRIQLVSGLDRKKFTPTCDHCTPQF